MPRRTKAQLKEMFANGAVPNGLDFESLIDSLEENIHFEEVTIVGGAITRTQINHTLNTEANAATDVLTTINGGEDGQIIRLRLAYAGRTVTVEDGTANINMGGSDFGLDQTYECKVLIYNGNTSEWNSFS